MEKSPLESLLTLDDFEAAAKLVHDRPVFEFIASGAADEITLRWNRESFQRLALLPRVLDDKLQITTEVELFGTKFAHPIFLAPVSRQRLVHTHGEAESAKGAEAMGTPFVIGGFTTTSIEDIRRSAPAVPLWFQPYPQKDQGEMEDSVRRAEAAGCQALCLTMDAPIPGVRDRQNRAGFKLSSDLVTPHSRAERPTTWKDVEWLRSASRLPLVVKGILHPDDAVRAVSAGAAAVIVSNHGARCLDTALASIEALPAVIAAVDGRVPVLVDGGIRRGTDVLKALALGARAVLIGRPYVYGLAIAGAAGVARAVQTLLGEFIMAMFLTGQRNAGALARNIVTERLTKQS